MRMLVRDRMLTFANEGGTGVGTLLICRGFLDVIDDEDFGWSFDGLEL